MRRPDTFCGEKAIRDKVGEKAGRNRIGEKITGGWEAICR